MAINTLPVQNVVMTLLNDGPRLVDVHFYLQSDGTSGELVNTPVFDPKLDLIQPLQMQFDPTLNFPIPQTLSIRQVWWGLSWFDLTIGFSSEENNARLVLPRDTENHLDLREIGGVKDLFTTPNTGGQNTSTGQVLFTTKDFAPANSNGFVIISFKKD